MMLPMINEAVRCLDEAVVDTAVELDMALLLGLGLPQYLGGALKYADWLGLERVLTRSQRYGHLGPQWVTRQRVHAMATAGRRLYGSCPGSVNTMHRCGRGRFAAVRGIWSRVYGRRTPDV